MADDHPKRRRTDQEGSFDKWFMDKGTEWTRKREEKKREKKEKKSGRKRRGKN